MKKFESLTFITSNKNKANQVARYLSFPVTHVALELSEVQSLDLREIVSHKVREAYVHIEKPVLVEDVSLTFDAMGGLPGPFIKWFMKELGSDKICAMMNAFPDRSAVARIVYGLFDGEHVEFFDGEIEGSIAPSPKGFHGFGYDSIFIPEGYNETRGEMDEKEFALTSPRKMALDKLEEYLRGKNYL